MESIKTTENPFRGEKCVLSFEMKGLFEDFKDSKLTIQYIPDREIITDADFDFWFKPLKEQKWDNLEQLTNTIVTQIYNAALPFHVQTKLTYKNETHGLKRKIFAFKTQPAFKIDDEFKSQL